jgi:hypothetical protein
MTQFPSDDQRLVEFLRQHVGSVPPAAPGLEQQIMQAVASSPQQPKDGVLGVFSWQNSKLFAGLATASLLIAWTGYRLLTPPKPSAAELATVETFLESNWDGVAGGSNADGDWFLAGSPRK